MTGGPVCWVLPDLGVYHRARAAGYMAQEGVRPLVVLELGGKSSFAAFRAGDAAPPCKVVTAFPEHHYLEVPPAELVAEIRRQLDVLDPAVVCVPGWSEHHALTALDWCIAKGRLAILFSESQERDALRRRFAEALKSQVVRSFSAALVGGRTQAEYAEKLGIPADAIAIGYNAVENGHFATGAAAARAQAAKLRVELGLPERYFLASARFIPKKNLAALISAYGAYRERAGARAWRLMILGDGPERAALTMAAKEFDVIMPGFKSYADLPTYYGLAGAFVHVSLVEQWGLVVNEACAAGLPVIVSEATGSGAELVRHGINGLVVDANDTSAISRALEVVAAKGGADLAAMGRESQLLADHLGPARFGRGLCEAIAAAERRGPRGNAITRGLLRVLSRRRGGE